MRIPNIDTWPYVYALSKFVAFSLRYMVATGINHHPSNAFIYSMYGDDCTYTGTQPLRETWYLQICTFNGATRARGNYAYTTSSYLGATENTAGGDLTVDAGVFNLGDLNNWLTSVGGRIALIYLYNSVLDATDRAALWNNGAGI